MVILYYHFMFKLHFNKAVFYNKIAITKTISWPLINHEPWPWTKTLFICFFFLCSHSFYLPSIVSASILFCGFADPCLMRLLNTPATMEYKWTLYNRNGHKIGLQQKFKQNFTIIYLNAQNFYKSICISNQCELA